VRVRAWVDQAGRTTSASFRTSSRLPIGRSRSKSEAGGRAGSGRGFLADHDIDLVDMVELDGFTVRAPPEHSMTSFGEAAGRARAWSIHHVDVTHSAYAAAQCVLKDLRDEPACGPPQTVTNWSGLRGWGEHPEERDHVNGLLRVHPASFAAERVSAATGRRVSQLGEHWTAVQLCQSPAAARGSAEGPRAIEKTPLLPLGTGGLQQCCDVLGTVWPVQAHGV
jgi:hypothetical protein